MACWASGGVGEGSLEKKAGQGTHSVSVMWKSLSPAKGWGGREEADSLSLRLRNVGGAGRDLGTPHTQSPC